VHGIVNSFSPIKPCLLPFPIFQDEGTPTKLLRHFGRCWRAGADAPKPFFLPDENVLNKRRDINGARISGPNVSAQNRETVFRRPDHVIFAVPDRVLPRLYPSIHSVYAAKCRRPKPPKGVGFTDPLSGTLKAGMAF